MDFQPTLADALVTLRPLRAADWDALHAVASDPLIWAGHPAKDRWREPVFRRFFDEAMASGGALIALDPATGEVIGASRYDLTRAGPGEVEIGWTFLARSRWGGRTNAAMKRLMVGHALAGCARVIFLVGEDNIRSRKAMEKIGGVLTDRLHPAPMAGGISPHVVYAIDREAFDRGPLGDAAWGEAAGPA
jgi:RimJ/RimL family protein N-acetyltransferase